MGNRAIVIIGVGGSGIELTRRIAREVEGVTTLMIDTDATRVREFAPRDHFHLGGFSLKLALDTLDPKLVTPEIRSQLSRINVGASARAEIGQVAFEIHRTRLAEWLDQRLREVKTAQYRIIVLGSLSGGTGAGVMPELGELLQQVLQRSYAYASIYGLALGNSFFDSILPVAFFRSLSSNEQHAVGRLTEAASGGQFRGYDDFQIIDIRHEAYRPARDEILDAVAQRILARWVLREDVEASSTAGDSEGLLLLGLSAAEGLEILWTPASRLAAADRASAAGPDLAFYVPRFRERWGREIDEFRRLIHSPRITEADTQAFLERHRHFLTGFDYERAVPHVALHGVASADLIPDFMLVPFGGELADIVELKHPRHQLVVEQGGHARISARLLQAIAQVRDYAEFFEREDNRDAVLARYGFTAYKPKLTVVIGTRESIQSELLFRRVTSSYPNVAVVTYEDILARAARWVRA